MAWSAAEEEVIRWQLNIPGTQTAPLTSPADGSVAKAAETAEDAVKYTTVATGSSATSIETNLGSPALNYYRYGVLVFLDSANKPQARPITASTITGTLTIFPGVSPTPSSGDRIVIVGYAG